MCVLLTLTDQGQRYPMIYAVAANPITGLLDRTLSQEHLTIFNESIKCKSKTKASERKGNVHGRGSNH